MSLGPPPPASPFLLPPRRRRMAIAETGQAERLAPALLAILGLAGSLLALLRLH